MADNNLDDMARLQQMLAGLTDSQKQQAGEDLNELRGMVKDVNFQKQVTAKSLRKAADKLDALFKDCKKAHASGVSASILGGVLTFGGGVATLMTWGIAAPILLAAGIGVGVGGAVVNIGSGFVENAINSTEIKKAENDLKKTLDGIDNVKRFVDRILNKKDEARLLYTLCLAMQTLKLNDPVVKLLYQAIISVANVPAMEATIKMCPEFVRYFGAKVTGNVGAKAAEKLGAQAAGDLAESGAKSSAEAGSKLAGEIIIGVSAFFLVLDAVDLGYAIRDIVENKGSEAASDLRDKADELEKSI